jgi:microcystin degradation protein MlrC
VTPTSHFTAAFDPIAKRVIHVDGDATLSRDDENTRPRLVSRLIF